MDISVFKSQIDQAGGSLARPNRFQVFIPIGALTANSTTIAQTIQGGDEFPENDGTDWMTDWQLGGNTYYRLAAFCEKSEIPGYQFQTDTQRIYGPQFKFPHMPEWQDVTMSFFVGADWQEKIFFEAWMYMVMDPISNNFNYRVEYGADIMINMYDETDTPQYLVTLISAYPISITSMPISYEDNNSVARLQVTFTYRKAQDYGTVSPTAIPPNTQTLFQNTVSSPPAP